MTFRASNELQRIPLWRDGTSSSQVLQVATVNRSRRIRLQPLVSLATVALINSAVWFFVLKNLFHLSLAWALGISAGLVLPIALALLLVLARAPREDG